MTAFAQRQFDNDRPGPLQFRQRTIGVADLLVSNARSDVLVTFALGSCIGVTLYDPVVRAAGLLHFQLPEAPQDDNLPNAALYGDTGFELLMQKMIQLGAEKRRLIATVAGGANMLTQARTFDIGRLNTEMVRDCLREARLRPACVDIGGTVPRTMYLRVADGAVKLRTFKQSIWLHRGSRTN